MYELIAGYRAVIQRCHNNAIKVIGCTITPFGGYLTADSDAFFIRREINRRILESAEFDGVADFAGAIANPSQKNFMLPAFDSGDHLHPNNQGGQAMAECVDLELLF